MVIVNNNEHNTPPWWREKHIIKNEVIVLRKKNRSYRNKSNLCSKSGAKPKKEKRRHFENEKEKFRKSKEWKEFRSRMAILFNHRDYITGRRLIKGFNLHHLKTNQTSESYQDISNEKEFIPLNSYCHKMLHYIFTYYQKDKTIIQRLVEVLDMMCELIKNDGEVLDQSQEDYGEDGELFEPETPNDQIERTEEEILTESN